MTTSNEMSDLTPHLADSTSSADSELLDTDLTILKKIVSGTAWMQIQGKRRDHINLEKLVKDTMKEGTLRDVMKHPDYLEKVDDLKKLKLQDLTKNQSQGVDVLAAFVQTYIKQEEIQLAQRVRNWARYMARQLVLNETHPFANSPEQKLVKETRSDLRFGKSYSFKSWEEVWKHPSRGDPSSPVKLVSIDSEKVYVKCEECGRKFSCVARLCAVGSDYETLIDEFIKPAGTVIEYCTDIHGITEEDLQGATLTQADAQARVMDLITPGTILVGHNLFGDLNSLRIDYKRVIDTTMLFVDHRKQKNQFCSLAHLCDKILGFKLREEGKPHDCLDDATVPMKLVHHLLKMTCSDD